MNIPQSVYLWTFALHCTILLLNPEVKTQEGNIYQTYVPGIIFLEVKTQEGYMSPDIVRHMSAKHLTMNVGIYVFFIE